MDRAIPDKTCAPAALLPATLDAEECAGILRCSKQTVEELAFQGALPATRFGRGWVFVTDQILAYLKARCETEAQERWTRMEGVGATRRGRGVAAVFESNPRGRRRKALPILE